jgi:hypothetical protein
MDADEVFLMIRGGVEPSPSFEAMIASNPASVDEGVKVIIEAMDGNRHFGPIPWMSRNDDAGNPVYPQRGNRALVTFSNEHEAWVIAWWPYG